MMAGEDPLSDCSYLAMYGLSSIICKSVKRLVGCCTQKPGNPIAVSTASAQCCIYALYAARYFTAGSP